MTAQLPWASGPDKAAGSGIGVPADFPGKIGDGTFRLAITSSSAIGRRGSMRRGGWIRSRMGRMHKGDPMNDRLAGRWRIIGLQSFVDEIEKRRTFAIISHPDAGKTTLTEKLLL